MAINYFIYARKSSESDDRQMASINDQVSEMKKMAQDLSLNVVDTITEAMSAKAPGRPRFNDMLVRMQKGEADGILCWKLNRLARNPVDGGQISWLLQNQCIKHIQTYGRDYKPSDNVVMMQVEFGMANQFVKDLSVDVKRGLRKKAERGWYPSSWLPAGYMHNPLKQNRSNEADIIIDTQRMSVVKELWKKMESGRFRLIDMVRLAEQKGLRNRYGNPYSYNTIRCWFSSEFYAGYFTWEGTDGSTVRYKGKHKAVISLVTYEKVQRIIRNKSIRIRERPLSTFFPYKACLRCGECSGVVTSERKLQAICTNCKHKFSVKTKQECPRCQTALYRMTNPTIVDHTYYHCTAMTSDCRRLSVSKKGIEKFLLTELQKTKLDSSFKVWVLSNINVADPERSTKTKTYAAGLRKRLSELENRIQNYSRMRADSEISKEEYVNLKEKAAQETVALQRQILEVEETQDNWFQRFSEWVDSVENFINSFEKASEEQKNNLAISLDSNLILKDKKLTFSTQNPIILLQECAELWSASMGSFEPKKTYTPLDEMEKSTMINEPFSVLCAKLNEIRTCLTDISKK